MNTNIRIGYRTKENKSFKVLDDCLLKTIQDGFENNLFISINIEAHNNNMQIEFGDKCCFINMDDEEKGEIYVFINNDNADEIIDLFVNCYPKNMLCFVIDDILQILKTFVNTGEPDNNYTWNLQNM
jgi:hypothetical protein